MGLSRRQFVVRSAGAALGGPALLALVAGRPVEAGVPAVAAGASPYGPLAAEPDQNGLLLPAGFTSRVVAVAGEPVGATSFVWPPRPDGAGIVPTDDGGWCYVCNSNLISLAAAGSVSGLRFSPAGEVVDAYLVLSGSSANSGGATTPWGTWLSVEEDPLYDQGLVWECDPTGAELARALPALGRFSHHSAAVDPVDGRVYLTQSHPFGLLYRFTPTRAADLSEGVLEACVVEGDGSVSWSLVADPLGAPVSTREQVPGATKFAQGSGAWVDGDWLYVATELDHTVHGFDLRAQRYRRVWQGDPGAALSNCDVLNGFAESGDLLVGRHGPARELVLITVAGDVAPLVRLSGAVHEGSRLTGPVFDPSGTRLYVSSQRATTAKALGTIVPGLDPADFACGITYEITGPFVGAASSTIPPVVDTTVPAPASSSAPVTSSEVTASTAPSTPSTVAPIEPPPTSTPLAVPPAGSSSTRSIGMGAAAGLAVVGAFALFQRFSARRAGATVAQPAEQPSSELEAVDEHPDPFEQLVLPFDAVVEMVDEIPSGAPEESGEAMVGLPADPEAAPGLGGRPDIGERVGEAGVLLGFESRSFDLDALAPQQLGYSQAFDLTSRDPDRLHTPDDYSGSEEEAAALHAAEEARRAEEAAIAVAMQVVAGDGVDAVGVADSDGASTTV